MNKAEHASLYYREGGSDKVYHAHLQQSGTGWSVTFEYGRRGGALKAGSKTSQALSFDEAKRIFDGLVREKMAKGYSPGEEGVPFAGTSEAGRKTGHQPQLLNPTDDPESLIEDPAFWAQEKFDGTRTLVERANGKVTGINRRGLAIPLPEPLVKAMLAGWGGDFVVDGELVGTTYHPFDVLDDGPYSARLKKLNAILGYTVPTAKSAAEKRKLFDDVQARDGEGVVFKRHDAPYRAGRPASGGDQFKFKFTQTASCVVVAASKSKRSVELGLVEGPEVHVVGNVTIPPNHDIPHAGQIVEVRYLYAFPGGALFQPVYLGPREDVDREDCTLAPLKFKPDA